jgi:DNA-binding NarL/FixJ family response regulator
MSLNISVETVKEHVQNILRKLNAPDRTAAAVWAVKTGVIE